MVSTWIGDHLGVEMDAAVQTTVKSQERKKRGASNTV